MNRPYSEAPDPHPTAYKVLYELYRKLDCPAAVDPADPEDCANVAAESVRALLNAGLLLPEGAETRTEWGWDCGHPRAPEQTCVHPGPEEWARATAGQVWPDGALVSRWTAETPWLAVGDSKPSVQDPSVSVEETPQ